VHIAGERLFVDFAGHTMEVIDAATGEIQRAEIFVAVLGASSFIYAEATGSLKAGITRACFYEPTVNRTYADMAAAFALSVV
jgi:transposase